MKELEVAERAAIEAGKVALGYFQKDFVIRKKGKIDLVTDADVACEKRIKKVISEEYPAHSFLGEEEGRVGKGRSVWHIDPIDGTTNFAHGFDYFSHSIALEKDGELVCGVVYNPVQKKLYSAIKGKGAFLNKKRIQVSAIDSLINSVIVTGYPYDSGLRGKSHSAVGNLLGNCQGIRRFGSAALDFCRVAEGSCDAFFEYTLNSWDVAAGLLIVREANGYVSDVNGNEASPDSGHFVASNGLVHKQLLGYLERV